MTHAVQIVVWQPPLLLEHEGAQAPDETAFVVVVDVDHCTLAPQGVRELDPPVTVDVAGQEHPSSVNPHTDFPYALDADAALANFHELQAVLHPIPNEPDGLVQAVVFTDWTPPNSHPDGVQPWLGLGIILEGHCRSPYRIGLDLQVAHQAIVTHSIAGGLQGVVQRDWDWAGEPDAVRQPPQSIPHHSSHVEMCVVFL